MDVAVRGGENSSSWRGLSDRCDVCEAEYWEPEPRARGAADALLCERRRKAGLDSTERVSEVLYWGSGAYRCGVCDSTGAGEGVRLSVVNGVCTGCAVAG